MRRSNVLTNTEESDKKQKKNKQNITAIYYTLHIRERNPIGLFSTLQNGNLPQGQEPRSHVTEATSYAQWTQKLNHVTL